MKKKKSLMGWTYQDWFLDWQQGTPFYGEGRASQIFKSKDDVRDKTNEHYEGNPIKIRVTFEEIK